MPRVSRLITAFLLSLFLTESSFAVSLGYVTGNEYWKFSENERTVWFIGFMDGLMAEDNLSESRRAVLKNDADREASTEGYWLDRLWTARCAERYPISQLKAVFEKELRDKPDAWHAPAAFIARGKIYEMCKKQ